MDDHYQNLIKVYDQYPIYDLLALANKFEEKQENLINLQAIRYVIAKREFYDVDTVLDEVD